MKRRLAIATTAAFALSAHCLAAAPSTRPNIIVIMSDDMGYSDIGAYGGEIRTPTLDSLAAASSGKKFSQFYNTARCCPSRASLLTGLYPHQAGIGHLINNTGHIGYGDHLTSDTITLPEALKQAGYGTYMSGKWHMAPRSYDPIKDKQHWPRQRGFDRFYGTIAGSGSFYDPGTLTRDDKYISPLADPEYKPKDFYYTDAISDNAIKFVSDHLDKSADKPFFLYVAYTSAHWPIQAPQDEIDAYKGHYAAGYEAIHSARIDRLKTLDLLPNLGTWAKPIGDWSKAGNKPVKERLMEAYAAMVTRMDKGIGKLINTLEQRGAHDNTLVFYLQDNGGCAEDPWPKTETKKVPETPLKPEDIQPKPMADYTRDGKGVRTGHDVMAAQADTQVAYLEEWANVSNSPFRLYKHFMHEGGISTPLIAYWPAVIKATTDTKIVRTPAHLIDLAPTILEAAGATQPTARKGVKVQPIEGVSLLPLLKDSGPVSRGVPLFWEHEGNRAVRTDKWKLVATSEQGPWELYDMTTDRGEMNDLASEHPDVVKDLAVQWDAYADRARVRPLGGWRDQADKPRAAGKPGQKTITMKQGDSLPKEDSLPLKGNGVRLEVEVLEGPVEGVLVSQGAHETGFSLYAEAGKLHLVKKNLPRNTSLSTGDQFAIPATPFTVIAEMDKVGNMSIAVGDQTVKSTGGEQGGFTRMPLHGLSAGLDDGKPVGPYDGQNPFKGKLGEIKVSTLEN